MFWAFPALTATFFFPLLHQHFTPMEKQEKCWWKQGNLHSELEQLGFHEERSRASCGLAALVSRAAASPAPTRPPWQLELEHESERGAGAQPACFVLSALCLLLSS